MNERDEKFLDRIEPILREMYGKNWDYDFDVNEDGIYLRLNVWARPQHDRQEDIDEYLDRYGYATVEEWAEDSNYVLRDGKWYAQDGLVVDPATCLVESIDELISRYE